MELEFYADQKMEEQVTEQKQSGNPICRECDIPMTLRTNRMNREDFWGCMRFPCCKFTLPLEMYGSPARTAQIEQEAAQTKKEKLDKAVIPRMPKRPSQAHASQTSGYRSSDGSWQPIDGSEIPIDADSEDQASLVNANLSMEEMEMLTQMRHAKGNSKQDKTT